MGDIKHKRSWIIFSHSFLLILSYFLLNIENVHIAISFALVQWDRMVVRFLKKSHPVQKIMTGIAKNQSLSFLVVGTIYLNLSTELRWLIQVWSQVAPCLWRIDPSFMNSVTGSGFEAKCSNILQGIWSTLKTKHIVRSWCIKN